MVAKTKTGKARNSVELDHAVELLRNEIQTGQFIAGQRLVESDVMAHLELSRGRVREVFKCLEAEGLVQIDKNRGASVRKMSRQEMVDTTEVLEDISILMIRKASKRIDENTNRKKLKDSLKAARQFRRDSPNILQVQAYMDENARFWGSLAELAGNPVLSDIRMKLQSQLFRFAMQGLIVKANQDKWITLHEDIITALLNGEIGHAVKYARKSMADVWEAMLNLPDNAFSK